MICKNKTPLAALITMLITFTLFASIASAQSSGDVSLCVNSAVAVQAPGNRTAHIGFAFALQINATDADNDTLTYADNTSLFAINETIGLINFTANQTNEGTHSILINVTEASSCPTTASTSFFLTVANLTAVCGDGNTTSPETCDDGNTNAGDGCSAACATEAGGGASPAAGGGGGGGGACTERWTCSSWGPCIAGSQVRECTDRFDCGTTRSQPVLRQSCLVAGDATCTDGIRNNGEDGVDCGGSCSSCQTCSDGILNQNEDDVDCGGSCSACLTCSDRAQNQGEEGIDCGGPCPACVAQLLQVPASHVREFCTGDAYGVCLTTTVSLFSLSLLGILLAIGTWPRKPYWAQIK